MEEEPGSEHPLEIFSGEPHQDQPQATQNLARSYETASALRLAESVDGVTANWGCQDRDFLRRISTRIINNLRGLKRVVPEISSKPPGKIEWERIEVDLGLLATSIHVLPATPICSQS